jgi:predicted ribosome quality control (RQC) complex YloA/Tae2 family protein
MAIEFRYKGTMWRADTAEEAVALRNELEKRDKAFVPEHETMDQLNAFWTPDKFMDVINGIGDLQKRMLAAILRKSGITAKELVKKLGLDSEVSLAGVISGLSKQLKKLGIEPKRVFVIDVKWAGKVKTRSFILEDFFLSASLDLNWPDAWEKKEKQVQQK